MALRAQQLLEVSLLADMRAVVARALSGLDMFADEAPTMSPSAASAAGALNPFGGSDGAAAGGAAGGAGGAKALGSPHIPRKATIREGVFSGLNALLESRGGSLSGGSASAAAASLRRDSAGLSPHVEHKIETLVAAPAAVEDALASLIVDHGDRLLQSRALLTYVKRIYHPFLLREPVLQVSGL